MHLSFYLSFKLFNNILITLKLIVASFKLIISTKLLKFYICRYLIYNKDLEDLSIKD